MKVWTEAQSLMSDCDFVAKFTVCNSKFLPFHMAFLYCGKTLVATASNTTAFGHAEINCINAIKQKHMKLNHPIKLIVARISNSGEFNMSRPCYDCCQILKKKMPRARVYYTDADGELCEECDLNNSHHSLSRRNKMYCMPCE